MLTIYYLAEMRPQNTRSMSAETTLSPARQTTVTTTPPRTKDDGRGRTAMPIKFLLYRPAVTNSRSFQMISGTGGIREAGRSGRRAAGEGVQGASSCGRWCRGVDSSSGQQMTRNTCRWSDPVGEQSNQDDKHRRDPNLPEMKRGNSPDAVNYSSWRALGWCCRASSGWRQR